MSTKDETFEMFITTHALTNGIERMRGRLSGDMFVVKDDYYSQYFHKEGRDWHRTLESAKAQAEKKRLRKIKSLRKSLEKLEAMKF